MIPILQLALVTCNETGPRRAFGGSLKAMTTPRAVIARDVVLFAAARL